MRDEAARELVPGNACDSSAVKRFVEKGGIVIQGGKDDVLAIRLACHHSFVSSAVTSAVKRAVGNFESRRQAD